MILVTGGGGYLGGRIVDYLKGNGFDVKIANRCIFESHISLMEACNGVEVVIHLAAMNSQDSFNSPEKALMVNGLNTLNLLDAAEKSKVLKFIYFSTIHVYGPKLNGYIDETALPYPVGSYSITHRLAEDYVLDANFKGNISTVVFRLSNAVGSPMSKLSNCWMLIANNLCKQVVVKKVITLKSNIMQQRDFVPISSISKTVSYFLDAGVEDKQLYGSVYNLSSGVSLSLKDLSNLISERAQIILGINPDVNFSLNCEVKDMTISNNKLKNIGLSVDSSLIKEIDGLLLNCKLWFSD